MAGRPRSQDTRERDAQALDLKHKGLNYKQICDQLGYKSTASAHAAVKRALRDLYPFEHGEQVQIEMARLDDVFRTLYRVMHTRHLATNGGRLITGPDGVTPLIDDGPVISAALGIVRTSESVRKLLGTDAPSRARVQVITQEDVDAEYAELMREEAAAEAVRADAEGDRSGLT